MADSSGSPFLYRVYGIESPDDARRLYADWATRYDADLKAQRYASPRRCAEALAAAALDKDAPILDVGAGTGLSGEAFRDAGFTMIDGNDFSPEMLDVARAKQVYRALTVTDLADPLPFAPGDYAHVAAVGVFSPEHAPPSLIDDVLAKLPTGGCFVFTLNEHALAEKVYEERVEARIADGTAEIVHRDFDDHLPGLGSKSLVLVLRRL